MKWQGLLGRLLLVAWVLTWLGLTPRSSAAIAASAAFGAAPSARSGPGIARPRSGGLGQRTLIAAAVVMQGHTSARAASLPIVGTWQMVGTAPPGFTRHGVEVARITITLHGGKLTGTLTTGSRRYGAAITYDAARHDLRLTVHTSTGVVRLDAVVGRDTSRLVGTWYDARGNDGGMVLIRLTK